MVTNKKMGSGIWLCFFVLMMEGLFPLEAQTAVFVLDWNVNTNHTGIYVAQELGFFKEEGLSVSIQYPPAIGGESLLLSGVADFAVSYQESITYARVQGKDLTALAAVIQHNTSGFAAPKDRGIESPLDLQGKRYGTWDSPPERAFLQAIMKKAGGNYSSITFIPVGAMDFFTATARDVDFCWIFWGWTGVAAQLKGIDLSYFPLRDVDPALDFYTPVIATKESFIRQNPELTRRFMRALARGYRFCIENPDKAAEILLTVAPELDENLVRHSQRFLSEKFQDDAPRWGMMRLSVWQNYAKWLDDHGLLGGPFNAKTAFTNEFLP